MGRSRHPCSLTPKGRQKSWFHPLLTSAGALMCGIKD
jgi:hypothetical protein